MASAVRRRREPAEWVRPTGVPAAFGQRLANDLELPLELEEDVNDALEELDGLPFTEYNRRRTEIVWGAIESLRPDDRKPLGTKSRPKPKTPGVPTTIHGLIAAHHERAILAGSVSTLTDVQWVRLRDAQDGECAYCGDKVHLLTLDHIIPIHRMGPNTLENVIGACGPCNASKGRSDPMRWMERKGIEPEVVFARIATFRGRSPQ